MNKNIKNNINYNKKDIVRRLSYKLNIHSDESKFLLDCTLDVFKDMFLEPTEKTHIEIRNFGVFDIFYTNERSNARNINTGQSVVIPKRKKIVFKPSKKIKEKLYK